MLLTLALERQSQEGQEFKTNLVYVAGVKGSMDWLHDTLSQKKIFFQGESFVSILES